MEGQAVSLKGRVLVEGNATGKAVVVEALSFYGEVDPKTGTLNDGRSITGRVLVIGRPRGSTVGSYTIYGLKYYGKAPKAIIVENDADPILVAGAVLAGIPLVDRVMGALSAISDCDQVEVLSSGVVRVYKSKA
ncbi:MAG: DUF126 domain-containing protein [Desulfurococcales archaeon]|nr:DUF126 domain-containing protein [Desulfurococcales archaeon]